MAVGSDRTAILVDDGIHVDGPFNDCEAVRLRAACMATLAALGLVATAKFCEVCRRSGRQRRFVGRCENKLHFDPAT